MAIHIHLNLHKKKVVDAKDGLNFYGLNKPRQVVLYKGKTLGLMGSSMKWYIEDNPADKDKLNITHGFRSLEDAKKRVDKFLD